MSASKRVRGRSSATAKGRRASATLQSAKKSKRPRVDGGISSHVSATSRLYFELIPAEPLRDIVRRCSERPDERNWLAYLDSSAALTLLKLGGGFGSTMSEMITGVEITKFPSEALNLEKMDDALHNNADNNAQSDNLLRISATKRTRKSVQVLLKAAGTNLKEVHIHVSNPILLEVSGWIKKWNTKSIRKLVFHPDADFSSHHMYCVLNACANLTYLKLRECTLSLSVIGTIARQVPKIEHLIISDCYLQDSLEPLWGALKDTLKSVRVGGVYEKCCCENQIKLSALKSLAGQCGRLEKVEIVEICRNGFPKHQEEDMKKMFDNLNITCYIEVSPDEEYNEDIDW